MQPLVSVIVPVYNSEKYLPRCLLSILESEFKNLEIILVDDGSTDGTGLICDRFRDQDSRVIVLHQANGGVSRARNAGMEAANGAYIAFVDGDDWIDEGMYRDMVDRMESVQTDLIMCGYSIYDGVQEEAVLLPWSDNDILTLTEIREKLIPGLISPRIIDGRHQELIMGSIWRVLFKRDLITENGLVFDGRINRCEDLAFMVHALSLSASVCILNKPYYHYRQDLKNGVSTTHRYLESLYTSLMYTYAHIENITRENQLSSELQGGLAWRKIQFVLTSIHNLVMPSAPYRFRDASQEAQYYLEDSGFKKMALLVDPRLLTFKNKISVWLARHNQVKWVLGFYFLKYHRQQSRTN